MPLPFGRSLDMKLLELVKENSVLYNPRHPKYSDCDTREVTWQKIGDALSRPAQICKSRWLNIRDMMRKTLRNRIRYPDQYFRKYRYEEELSFMIPFFKLPNDLTEYLEESTGTEIPAFGNNLNLEEEKSRYRESIRRDIDSVQELNPSDPLDVFLMSIGCTLKKFDPYYLNQAKSKIFQVCQEYELQQIMEKPEQMTSCSTNG